ncbi:MAG: hypothetical protein II988_04370 [Clostridia bacterium]|nr:hypothetical protein [Clostridia bacterium]
MEEIKCVYNKEKVCNDCGMCDEFCELDPNKKCDNCEKCLNFDMDYKAIQITKIIKE